MAIARAIVMRPKLLLADEPTGNLDSAAGRQVLEVLEGLHADGITLVVVTHNPAIAGRARRTLVMQDGRIAERLSGSEVAGRSRPAAGGEALP